MKTCKSCGAEIAKSAKVCPNCGAKQKGKLGIIIAVLAVLLVIGIVAGGGGESSKPKIDNSGSSGEASSSSTENEATTEESETEEEGEEESVVLVGGTYEDDGYRFTVDSADLEYELKDNAYGLYDLDEGLHYISVSFTFENTGSSDKYVSIYDFDCYADNVACEQQFVTADTGDFINANLSADRQVSFTALYAVPDGASTIELEYTANVWTSEKVIVKLQ